MRKQKGFTLVELLIVVVIIAILAAMVVPRFLSQPEKAVIAEANVMLGALARAQNTTIDSGVGTGWVAVGTDEDEWNAIGMRMPAASKNWTFSCDGSLCQALRSATGGDNENTVLSINSLGVWDCPDPYKEADTGGCELA
jgi:prepilin-type N-terminal cleavage/methylation domain-containing protein